MPLQVTLEETVTDEPPSETFVTGRLTVQALTAKHKMEALAFLAGRSLHTVFMMGLILDNGVESLLNRGRFYACRDERGHIEGIAVIGHATLIETHSEAAIEVFAHLAQSYSSSHMIIGERGRVERFWHYYADSKQPLCLLRRELMFGQSRPLEISEEAIVRGLRQATLADLSAVMPVHAEMAYEESGVNPMRVDPTGFRLRCARRIEQGRVWVWIEHGQLIFKADVIAQTPEAAYLEGIHVTPEKRAKGYGLRCLSQLSQTLLKRTNFICLLFDEQKLHLQAFYQKAGYKFHSYYDTIYLHSCD